MSKVLVDREWLKRLHRDLDACQKVIWLGLRGADPAYCQDAQDRLKEIDELLAQPAEAEGAIQCPASHPAECYALGTHVVHASLVHGIVRQADELNAALSAVTAELTAAAIAYRIRGDVIAELTAERDRLRKKWARVESERDQLRAERDGLRKDAERWRYVSLQGDDTHWLNLLRVDLEDFGGNINAAVDALIDGDTPAMAAKEA